MHHYEDKTPVFLLYFCMAQKSTASAHPHAAAHPLQTRGANTVCHPVPPVELALNLTNFVSPSNFTLYARLLVFFMPA